MDPMDDLAAEPGAAALLGDASAAAPPAALRDRVLAAAMATRTPGRPDDAAEISAPESFRRALRDMGELIDALTDDESRATTIEGWTVAGLIGHLTAIDEHFGATLGWWPATQPTHDDHDHLAMTIPAVRAAQAEPFATVRQRWHDTVRRMEERLDGLERRLTERVDFHGFDFSVRSLLIARTFEVWTHSEDVRTATGRPIVSPDVAQLRLMTAAAVGALPIGMLLTGRAAEGRSVRVVLTGPGGGSWVQALELGAAPSEPELTIVADAIEFCRVAAKRRAPEAIECSLIGDPELAIDILGAAAIFAA